MHIPYGRQDIDQSDIDAVINILKSKFLTQGPAVPQFEDCLSNYTSARYAVAVNSATSALHIACMALGVGEGDLVWTSPITFVASANAALYCGAVVDFVDVDYQTNNMCVDALETKLEWAKKNNRIPKVVIPVHLAGTSCNMERIYQLALEYNFKIIEDASHAIGGTYKNKKIGACEYSDITVFSFHPVKIITTAEGGAALTNDHDLFKKLTILRTHGVTREPKQMVKASEGGWYYEQIALGYNYRMTDLNAALGSSQMLRIDKFVKKRNALAKRYSKLLKDLPLNLPQVANGSKSAFHLYVVKLQENAPLGRKQLYDHLIANNIGVNVHYIPVHLQPYYQKLGFKLGDFPISELYYSNAISLPLHPNVSASEQDYVISKVSEAFL